MVEGVQNPRTAIDSVEFNRKFTNYLDNSARMMVNHRNKVKWEDPKTKDRVNLMHMKEGEYLVGFGGRLDSNSKEYNMHYFNQEEC